MSGEHEERKNRIFSGSLPPRGTAAYESILSTLKKHQTPEIKAFAERMWEVFRGTVFAISKNGAGFPIDQLQRYYLQEFNHRAAVAGLYSMPTSFAFMDAFMEFRRPVNVFVPKPEINTLCSFSDFLDWVTSTGQEPNYQTLRGSIDSGCVYLFSNTSNPQLLQFQCKNGSEVSILGAALVRDRDEIVVVLQISESEPGDDMSVDWETAHKNLKKILPFAAAQKENLRISSDFTHGRVRPIGLSSGFESVAVMRFDIEKQAIINRGLYQDWGDQFRAFVDVAEVFGGTEPANLSEDQRKLYEASVKNCDEYQEVFELCRHFALLPSFSVSYTDHTTSFTQPTQLKSATSGMKEKKLVGKALDETRVYKRTVHRIDTPKDIFSGELVIKVPDYGYEDTGYWKILAPWEQGVDKKGLPEQGRTWIKKSLPERTAQAAHDLRPSKRVSSSPADRTIPTFGFIYVMRSAQHEKDVFKIGLTKRDVDIRAKELTTNTSSVDQFSVMQQWEVNDCHKAEAEIHRQLDTFRVNKKREFFKCNYQHIFQVIHSVVESINSFRAT